MKEEGPTYLIEDDPPRITCKVCRRTSYNQGDVDHLYCGNCNAFHDPTPAPAPPETPRARQELQRAHDILLSVIKEEVELPLTEEQKKLTMACASVLCWCLGHNHNDSFERNLKAIEDAAAAAGYELRDRPIVGRKDSAPQPGES